MKCQACGFNDEEKQTLKLGQEPAKFISIDGHLTQTEDSYGMTLAYLYACPKCGTVKLGGI